MRPKTQLSDLARPTQTQEQKDSTMNDNEQTGAAASQKIELVAEPQRQTLTVTFHRKTSRKIGDDWNTAEAVVVLPLDADETMVAQAKDLADQLAGQFPLPEVAPIAAGVNTWFTPSLAAALPIQVLQLCLVNVGGAGDVVIPFGAKHKGHTVAEVFDADPGWCTWVGNEAAKPNPSPEMKLVCAAIGAYNVTKEKVNI